MGANRSGTCGRGRRTMRSLAGVATVLICATAASAAGAQSLSGQTLSAQSLSDPSVALAAQLNQAAFAPRSYAAMVEPAAGLIAGDAYEPGQGPVRWTPGELN